MYVLQAEAFTTCVTGLKQYPFQYLAFRCLLFLSFGLVEITAFLEKIAKMKEKFPYHMVPTCIIQVNQFQRNANLKLDRKAIRPPKELDDHKLLEQLY